MLIAAAGCEASREADALETTESLLSPAAVTGASSFAISSMLQSWDFRCFSTTHSKLSLHEPFTPAAVSTAPILKPALQQALRQPVVHTNYLCINSFGVQILGTHMHGLSLKAAPKQKDIHMLLHIRNASQPHHEPVIWLQDLWGACLAPAGPALTSPGNCGDGGGGGGGLPEPVLPLPGRDGGGGGGGSGGGGGGGGGPPDPALPLPGGGSGGSGGGGGATPLTAGAATACPAAGLRLARKGGGGGGGGAARGPPPDDEAAVGLEAEAAGAS
ncbi:MAG: hypothetical protein FRX49_03507 [Trebouxia sp. A1-2]|nr:MAG: hypothetical protein FRX49_03507 [Trebouxia sp. A1-2]